jgi:hypothetical protein
MSRPSLPIFACLAAALALSPVAAFSQADSQAPSLFSTSAPATAERAELNLPSFSSSSATALFAAPAQSTITSSAGPLMKPSGGHGLPFSGLAIGVKVGLAGIGFDVATPVVRQRLNLRGGASFLTYSPSTITVNNYDINGTLKFQNAAVMADFFPFRGWFRMSGGVTLFNDTGLTASLLVPGGQSVNFGNTTYYSKPSAPITGTGVFNFGPKTAGRASIGTGNMIPKKGHFSFQTELGVQFFTPPTVLYTFTGQGCTDATYTNCGPISPADIASEQSKIQNDLTELKYFPVLSFGLSYKIH